MHRSVEGSLDEAVVVLGDSRKLEAVRLPRVLWHHRGRLILALATDGAPLVGMSLLRGSKLQIRAEGMSLSKSSRLKRVW